LSVVRSFLLGAAPRCRRLVGIGIYIPGPVLDGGGGAKTAAPRGRWKFPRSR